jgi:hypothetical protein
MRSSARFPTSRRPKSKPFTPWIERDVRRRRTAGLLPDHLATGRKSIRPLRNLGGECGAKRFGVRRSSGLAAADLVRELRSDDVQVAHYTEVGELEDRRLGVLVDGHDGLGGLHAGTMLDRTGDAERDVELR